MVTYGLTVHNFIFKDRQRWSGCHVALVVHFLWYLGCWLLNLDMRHIKLKLNEECIEWQVNYGYQKFRKFLIKLQKKHLKLPLSPSSIPDQNTIFIPISHIAKSHTRKSIFGSTQTKNQSKWKLRPKWKIWDTVPPGWVWRIWTQNLNSVYAMVFEIFKFKNNC